MANKQISINLAFTADTTAAKRQLQDLQQILTNLTQTALQKDSLGLTKEISEAIGSVTELQAKLKQATTSSGTLDLGQFNNSFKESGITLKQYGESLASLGPEGVRAFNQISDAILNAEMPLKRTSGLLSNFATTLKNTVKWELSSSMIHSLESAFSTAWHYAQDLNESLNNIRIVTGYDIEQMTEFAEQANKAAKALSTTTTEYTDASLIYYQQGLTDKEVQERTDITIKMANAAGESATKVSDQLTAVWNNFYDGSKSLEYYVDVMTKLGAATASSTDEIAQGLEKFAAIADTVGLSYEYATAALATVTSNTRQSADVVGTAFKTIFARMQDLELGDTLDDGTTLGTYSESLAKVGINVLDTNGNLVEMDNLLDSIAVKWNDLSKAQQVSLAQSVAGVRQYTQLVALMDNWDAGDADSMVANLGYTSSAEGSLQEQADIYAESWKAAADQVQTALEGIYQDLINDEGIIKVLNFIEKVITGIDKIIEAMGGLEGILPLIAVSLSKLFSSDMAKGFDNLLYNIKNSSEKGKQEINDLRKEALEVTNDLLVNSINNSGFGDSAEADVKKQTIQLQEQLIGKTNELLKANTELTAEEQQQAAFLIDINKSLGEQYVQAIKNKDVLETQTESKEISLLNMFGRDKKGNNKIDKFEVYDNEEDEVLQGKEGLTQWLKNATETSKVASQNVSIFKNLSKAFENVEDSASDGAKELSNFKDKVSQMLKANQKSGESLDDNLVTKLDNLLKVLDDESKPIKDKVEEINSIIVSIGQEGDEKGAQATEYFDDIIDGAEWAGIDDLEGFRTAIYSIEEAYVQNGQLTTEQIDLLSKLGMQFDEAGKIIGSFKGKVATIGDGVSASISALSSFSFALSQAEAAGEKLFDPDVSGIQKLISLISLLSAVVNAYSSAEKAANIIKQISAVLEEKRVKRAAAVALAVQAEAASETVATVATGAHNTQLKINNALLQKSKEILMSHPIGIILVAITTVIGGISAINSAIERNNEEVAENAKKVQESADAINEEIEANEKLAKSFTDLLKDYQNSIDCKDDMVAAAEAAAEAYDIENKELLLQKEAYEELAIAIRNAQIEKVNSGIRETEKATNLAGEVFEDTMRDGLGYFAAGRYVADFGEWTTTAIGDSIVYATLSELVSDLGLSMHEAQTVNTEQDTDSMLEGYERILKIREAIEAKASEEGYEGLLDEIYYKNIVEWLEKSEDSYNNLIELRTQFNNLKAESKILELREDNENISTLKEYQAIKDQLKESLRAEDDSLSEDELENLAQSALEADTYFADMAKQAKIVSQAASQTNIDTTDLQDFYDKLSDEEKEVFATLNFNTVDSIEALEEQLDILQARANLRTITVKLEAVKSAKKDFKENMSAEEYADWEQSSGIDWGNEEEGIIKFSEFLMMTYEDQLAYLNNLYNFYKMGVEDTTQVNIDEANELKNTYEDILDKKTSERDSKETQEKINNVVTNNGGNITDENDFISQALKLSKFDKESQVYQDLYNELIEGLDETDIEFIDDYIQLLSSISHYDSAIEGLTNEINTLNTETDDEERDRILTVKTELEDASNLSELQSIWDKNKDDYEDGTLYQTALVQRAEQYDECAEAAERFKKARRSGDKDAIAQTQADLEAAIREQEVIGLEIKTLGDLEKARRSNKISIDNESAAYEQLAKKTTKGQEALYEYNRVILTCEEGSVEAAEALSKFKKEIEQIEVDEAAQSIYDLMEGLKDIPEGDNLNLSKYNDDLEKIAIQLKNIFGQDFKYDAAFVKENWDLISKYLEGTEEEQYQAALKLAAMGRAGTINLTDAVIQAFEEVGLNSEACKAEIQGVVNILQNADFDANGTLNIDTVQAIANVGALQTQAEKAAGILNSILGTDITLEVEGLEALNNALADLINNGPGIERGKKSWKEYAKSVTIKAKGTAPSYVAPDSLTTTGSKGGSSKTAEKKKESDVLDRYKEITDALDDVTRATEKASKAADRLYGKSRIDAMKQVNASLQQEIDLLKQKKSQAEDYFQQDYNTLNAAATAAGVSFTYDAEGNISNYTSQMRPLLDRYNALVNQVNADGNVTDKEQKQLDALDKLITGLKEAISQYDDTKELIQDLDEEITDKLNEWQDNNYEKLHYELEIEIELNDLQLEYIDYYLNKIEDDFYAMAEAATIMVSKTSSITNELGAYRDSFYQLTEAYRNAEISQADYIDGLKEAYEGILDQLSALTDLDKEMMFYYKDTLDAASEELSKYTDRMEHLTGVLDHYKNLIELINGEYDYKSISKMLDGQAKTLKNELDVATEYYQMLLDQRKELEAELLRAGSDAARELIQNELDAINAAVDEAQENMLAKTKEWAEAQKAIMENVMAEAAAEMEKAFTDGMGFDALSNSLSRLSSYADEYLTKTNQMYETQKLINTAQQAADKSTNEAAKVRLKAYTDEIEQLQNKNQLSNLELEIAKAKYDIVLAEIALEEAQNAKSTVRLQRDNEGNFGYVYTADQNAISQAESDLADAQNRLYNIGLEGTNEYGQKLLELQQELSDALVQLEENRAAGQYATDEEYYAAKDQLIQEYNNLFRAYSEQYTTALGVDTAIQEEAWINVYQNMIYKTADWQEATTEYTGLCEDAYKSWRDVVEAESAVVDAILNDLEDEVNDVTEASDNLRDEVVNEVIPAMEDQLFSVLNVTEAYAAQRDEIFELISYYEALAESIREVIREQSGLDGDDVDFNKDYSLLMNEAVLAGDMVALQQYAKLRDKKIAAGYSDYGISTQTLLNWLSKNGGITGNNLDWHKIIPGLATGGYTGSWGPEGRLALLHEKELVLNADDTNNFLAATSILRDAVKMIELQAIQGQVSTLPYTAIGGITGGNSGVDQNVRIEANFPNVQDRNEIQEAFNNLINTASQYANRK